MVDAGYELGDRLLYHRMPMLHGDDVADLQRRSTPSGSMPVDGIFEPAPSTRCSTSNRTGTWPRTASLGRRSSPNST
jgi:hypothetical protein